MAAGQVFHCATGFACRFLGHDAPLPGPHPDRATYGSFFAFEDPDHNSRVVQEVTTRLPGRVDPHAVIFSSAQALSQELQRAATHAHHHATLKAPSGPTATRPSSWPSRLATPLQVERSQTRHRQG